MPNRIEYDCKCKACKGTGLYTGMGERDGAAVVCYHCEGTGKQHIEITYESFEKREEHSTAEWIYQVNPSIRIGKGGDYSLSDFGGMPYTDWRKGKAFESGMENRLHTCPAWYYQCADCDKKPDWDTCNATFGSTFSRCPDFDNKKACWKKWDEEFSIHSEELKK